MSCAERAGEAPWLAMRQAGVALLVLATTGAGSWAMLEILRVGGITPLQGVVLVLFVITFGWISIAFWTAIIGFMLMFARRDPLTLARLSDAAPAATPGPHRTALVMPIHHEDPQRVAAGLASTCRSLLAQPNAQGFEVFVLSDSQDAEVARREQTAIAALQQQLAPRLAVHYRRRADNEGRKAGNVAEFCRHWGRRYDYFIVLDADSLMGGRTLVALVSAMQANPRLGLIQTVPIPVRSASVFGRVTQFAAALHSPLLAAGHAFWQGHTANFWGHNAIVRTRAFMESCGLPALPGAPPLGGEILSHDFVEAALLRRAGWQVQLDTRLGESFEEVPSNILEFAKRDRRWIQGNLQHLRLLAAVGLHPVSRLHFLFGALAYLSSLLWGLMLVISTLEAIGRTQDRHAFFQTGWQLFPDWPQATPELVMPLLWSTAIILLLPKGLGVLLAFIQRPAAFGGRAALLASSLLEVVIAILIAPLMMLLHSTFILGVLSGRQVGWDAQVREGRAVPWRDAWRHTGWISLLGAGWALVTHLFAPTFFWWLAPVWMGLLLATPLVQLTGSLSLGRRLRRAGLLKVPAEVWPNALLVLTPPPVSGRPPPSLASPPPAVPGAMPQQAFCQGPGQGAKSRSVACASSTPDTPPTAKEKLR